MTGNLAEVTAPANSRGASHKRRMIALVIAALILVGTGTAVITGRHLDHQYGPIESGAFGGIYSLRNLVMKEDDSAGHLVATPGATARLLASVDNRGAHSVKITAIDGDDTVMNIRWSVYRTVPDGAVSGVNTPWRNFPALVPAHGTIRLLITIHRPTLCQGDALTPGVGGFYSGYHRVHWDSIFHSHTTTLEDGLRDYNIQVC